MNKDKEKEEQFRKELDSYLSELTEVEIETESEAIVSLCETARSMEFYQTERPILDSFLEWARSESWKHQERINELYINNKQPEGEL